MAIPTEEWASLLTSQIAPVVLPKSFITKYGAELSTQDIIDLMEGRIVQIEGYWCVLQKDLK